jgi:hypothetical protein
VRRLLLPSLLLPATLGLALAAPGPAPAREEPAPAPAATAASAKPASAKPASGPRLTVDLRRGKHRISPLIYGLNGADPALAKRLRLPLNRWGGNATEMYNWRLRASNRAADWYFENLADCWEDRFSWCQGTRDVSAVDEQVRQDRTTGTASLVTLPMMGWVARDVSYDGPSSCAYPAPAFDPQDGHDPYHPECGSGRRGGRWIPGADPASAGTQVGPEFSAAWVSALRERYGAGGVRFYGLGNEPALWDETHHPFHPQPTTYDELWARSRDLAAATKAADPAAAVVGPSEWGWPNWFCSAADDVDRGCFPTSPDRAAHGGVDLSSWLLRQFAAYEQQTGTRLLDVFDLHYYEQGTYSPATDVTRSLWDPTFTDPSWIGQRIELLPRMRAWVRDNYPGTRLGLSEYNLGSGTDRRTQVLVQADTLGLFGRERLDLAAFWPLPDSPVPVRAFELFRDYDGHGAAFGDRGVAATSSDQSRVSVYAARVGRRGPLTVMVVNKATRPVRSRLALHGARGAGRVTAYRWAGRGIARLPGPRVRRGAVRLALPASSVTVLRIALPRRR